MRPRGQVFWRPSFVTNSVTVSTCCGKTQAMEQPIETRFVTGAERIGLLDFFAARGISEDQARTCLADTAAIEKAAGFTQRYGSEFDIAGTPTFQLNGQTVDANTWSALEPILQRAGAR